MLTPSGFKLFFFFNDTATTEIYTLSLHDALPISHALGMRVIATRASGRTGPDFVSYVGLPDELPKLAKDADFIVNCTPLTPQTTGVFNKEFFATLKPGAYFISVGRGRSTVTADLIAALASGGLA